MVLESLRSGIRHTMSNKESLALYRRSRSMNIAVAGTGYVGLSLATLLAQHNYVMAVDIIPEKQVLSQ